jgi:hypothetical protein
MSNSDKNTKNETFDGTLTSGFSLPLIFNTTSTPNTGVTTPQIPTPQTPNTPPSTGSSKK